MMSHSGNSFLGFLAAGCLLFNGGPAAGRLMAQGAGGASESDSVHAEVILLMSAPGEEAYESLFQDWKRTWTETLEASGARWVLLDAPSEQNGTVLEQFQTHWKTLEVDSVVPLWVILVGHGTFNGKEAKFNLVGPDLSVSDWVELLEPMKRPIVFLHCGSTSGAFLKPLAGKNRMILSATRNGAERNFTRLAPYLAQAFRDPEADLDQDQQVSLFEAYLTASRRVREFYQTEGRMLSEHSLLDDNGDGLGTPADWFVGMRATKKPSEGELDGFRSHQMILVPSEFERTLSPETRVRRDLLETEIRTLRNRKEKLSEEEYYRELEAILLRLVEVYGYRDPGSEPEQTVPEDESQ